MQLLKSITKRKKEETKNIKPKSEDGGDNVDDDTFESADDNVAIETKVAFEGKVEKAVTGLLNKYRYMVNLKDFLNQLMTTI